MGPYKPARAEGPPLLVCNALHYSNKDIYGNEGNAERNAKQKDNSSIDRFCKEASRGLTFRYHITSKTIECSIALGQPNIYCLCANLVARTT